MVSSISLLVLLRVCITADLQLSFFLLFNLQSFPIVALNSVASEISIMCMTIIVALSSHSGGVWGADFSSNNLLETEKSESSTASGKHTLTAAHNMMQTTQ